MRRQDGSGSSVCRRRGRQVQLGSVFIVFRVARRVRELAAAAAEEQLSTALAVTT